MSRLITSIHLNKLKFIESIHNIRSHTNFFNFRNVYCTKNILNYENVVNNRKIMYYNRFNMFRKDFNVPYKRFIHQENQNHNKNTNIETNTQNNNNTSNNTINNNQNNINGVKNGSGTSRKDRAIRRMKTRFQKFKGYINRSKRIQNLKVYLNQNKRLQNFKLYLKNNKRFQRFKLYIAQKRQNFKGMANKTNRREKLRIFKEKFKDKSLAFRLSALLTLKRYGKIGAFIYFSVYIITLAGMNAIVFMNYLTSEDVRKALNYFNITSLKVPDVDSPFAKFTVAYIATKLVEPLRLVFSILLTISVTKILKR